MYLLFDLYLLFRNKLVFPTQFEKNIDKISKAIVFFKIFDDIQF